MAKQPLEASFVGARQRRSDEFAGIAHSPAFVYCHEDLCRAASALQRIAARADCTLLYSIKACGLASVLEVLAPYVGGLAASSLFEARLAREALRGSGSVHLFTVGVTSEEIDEVAELSDYISLNSLSQLRRYGPLIRSRAKCGLRVNPGMSYVADERYDPCRRHSKLGVPIDGLLAALGADPVLMAGVYGLLIHTNCDSNDLGELLETLEHLDARLGNVLAMMQWVNLGGGYLFEEGDSMDPFYQAVGLLRSKYGLEVFIEPGAALVRSAGYLVSTVLDVFDSDGKTVVVVDTTVNHMPEVFEYQFAPDVIGHVDEGDYRYVVAGRSCLAGDLFGEYAFAEPLEVGSQVVFANVGAYSLSKVHTFNGINLPSVYGMTEGGELVLKQRFTYGDFASRYGVGAGAVV